MLLVAVFIAITTCVAISVTKSTLPSREVSSQQNRKFRYLLSCLGFSAAVGAATNVEMTEGAKHAMRKTASASSKTNSLAAVRILINVSTILH
jgi:hypothetical protein